MQQIIFFFIRNKNFLLFGILFLFSIYLTIQTHSFHNGKYVSSANFLSGNVFSAKSNVTGYFGLENENERLIEENKRLRTQLSTFNSERDSLKIDSNNISPDFIFRSARIINNTYSKTKNYLTLKKGKKDSIKIDMGVISSKGIIGIVNATSENFSTVQSILNTNSQINARLKKSSHFGSLTWDTKKPNIVQLIDIPRLAPVAVGDTIVTGGKSTIFPEGILIGTVDSFNLEEDANYYDLQVKLFNDMTNLKHVYIIENMNKEEILQLENEVENAE
ncbi:rod shape-determining protein MreC [Marixanthomonas sp. SCSIO 43207]|uniref:rod shape-determining protein MreC n=1 Tax=Marixanthomonas sp. SCSIO 43207 TaxID=2779360 RepID=UPI001CA93085|nr:rod shape-determining protein MreC [Marixanthomonas sp. SCSIO 43207]UAB81613.1 rod shape-determining protein MreC [Marixanthomonas sp. SCSIO 43207]